MPILALVVDAREGHRPAQVAIRACELTKPLEAFPETFDAYRYAVAHRDIIQRFGRFPHRNAILGRAQRADEVAAGNVVPW